MQECKREGIDDLPDVFSWFSSFHQKGKPFSETPRMEGDFLWRQLYDVVTAGNSTVDVAMFTKLTKVVPFLGDRNAGR